MNRSRPATAATTTAVALAVAGVALATYPALRPYGPESGAAGAADFASTAWLLSHALGMVGFVAIAVALRVASAAPPWPWTGRPVREAESRAWLAVALLLPYYGAEAYGLHAVGRHALDSGDAGVLSVADAFRYAPLEVTTFGLGLLVLVLVGGRLAHGLWHTGRLGRAGGVLAGLGLVTYLPQFFGTPGVRVLHGVVLGAGLVLVALATARAGRPPATIPAAGTTLAVAEPAPVLSRP
ncbi:hypothetical protein [Nocardioides deserti]|uniref:DUF4386 family protein n=1 Tax=Nocardioides deserti TaxID=1588644 RepID=A0ABR6UB74_9ACTN|nr:hypothetical protein [Nocardioides deserti]MBC2961603.1 hypothetical protein [Nocardioides deserti]GGO76734.1 hypothetical protein GCM10012276_30180 [Nocardioides deserti]